MSYNLIIAPQAVTDIEDAFEYYHNFSVNALNLFDDELQEVFDILELNPFFQIRYKKLRAVPFKSLPFLVFFELDEQEKNVYLYSVFNTHQDTNKYPHL